MHTNKAEYTKTIKNHEISNLLWHFCFHKQISHNDEWSSKSDPAI